MYINIKMMLPVTAILLVCSLQLSAKAPPLAKGNNSFHPPRIIRTCCSFGTELSVAGIPFIKKTDITSPDQIGFHHYLGNKDEGNGNIYTRKGGFIDLGHVRDCADWTAFLYNLIQSYQNYGDPIEIDLGSEGGSKTLVLNLPAGFTNDDAYELVGAIAFDLSLWHEIATWFGASYIPLIPERYSSFSPEDMYSNLLGIHLGIQALKSNLSYDEAMTLLISCTLDSLQAVETFKETYAAMEKVENIWWTRKKSLPSKKIILMRYMESGEILLPWLIPDEEDVLTPYTLKKPDARLSTIYELRIKLNYKFPVKSLFLTHINRTITQRDFGLLIAYIEKDNDHL